MKPTNIQFQLAQAVEEHLQKADTAVVFAGSHKFTLVEAKVIGSGLGPVIDGKTVPGDPILIDVTHILAVQLEAKTSPNSGSI